MRKKHIKIIVIVLLIIIGFLVYVALKTKEAPNQIVETFRQNLNITNHFQGFSLPIENNIKKSDFNFPSTLPYLKQTSIGFLNVNTIGKISANFGFDEDPLTFDDVQNGRVLIWNGDLYSLTITPKNNFIQLVSNTSVGSLIQNSGNEEVSDEDLKTIANNLLATKVGLNPNNIGFAGFSYFKKQNGIENLAKSDKKDAQIIQLNYSDGNFKYPILTTDPDKSQISIQLLKNGYLVNFTANLGFDFQNSLNEYSIKNYDQFSKKIGESILVSLNDNNVNLSDIKNSDIKKIVAEKVSLAYLLDFSNQKTVQPVFLIEGTALVNNFTGPINAYLYLPAFDAFN